ncbi:hypothetical protein D3C75_1274170 [compost metagenome]
MMTSVCSAVSITVLEVKVLKYSRVSSIAKVFWLMIMQVAFSSVNCGLNSNPNAVKKSIDFWRLVTGKLTKSWPA